MAFKGMVDGDGQPKSAERVNSIPAIFQQDWMDDLTLDAAEERFVNAPFGTLLPFQRTEASWLIERVAVLAWALDQATLPPLYEKVNGAKVSVTLGMFQADAKDRVERASLRNPDEIVMAANTYIALMWRLQDFHRDRQAIDFRKKLTEKEGHLVVDGLEFEDGDLAIRGLPISKLSEDILGLTSTVVYQRFRQFRWLIGLERGESTVTAVN